MQDNFKIKLKHYFWFYNLEHWIARPSDFLIYGEENILEFAFVLCGHSFVGSSELGTVTFT